MARGAIRSTPWGESLHPPASPGANRSSVWSIFPDWCSNFPIGAFGGLARDLHLSWGMSRAARSVATGAMRATGATVRGPLLHTRLHGFSFAFQLVVDPTEGVSLVKSLSYACAYVSGVIVAAVDLCQSFKKTSERSPAKQAALALAAATAIAAFAGQAKAQDEVNYSFFNSQLSGIDNEAQSDIMSLRNAVAGYDLTSLKNSFNTYAPAFAQLDSDFNAYSAQLSSDQQTFRTICRFFKRSHSKRSGTI